MSIDVQSMKNNFLLLIIGGIILAAGLGIAGFSTFSVTKQVLEDAILFENELIQPNLSIASVMKDIPANRQLFFSLEADPTNGPLDTKITDSTGRVLGEYKITKTPFTVAISTTMPGDITTEIKNVGTQSIKISGGVFNSPLGEESGGINVQDNSSLQTLVVYGIAILVGIGLVIAGIVLLIIGTIKYLKGKITKRNESFGV